ncbi:MAG: sigma-70 region 4 domain-containing protein, partial [Bryobacterales bacterium]|nr:sigma-70 region 4 domain-containing protein [Bryobacterales bacterium]
MIVSWSLSTTSIGTWLSLSDGLTLADRSTCDPGEPRPPKAAQLSPAVLAGLQPDQREAIVTHYYEHHDTSEVAKRMGRSPGAVRELMR